MIYEIYCEVCGDRRKVRIYKDNLKDATKFFKKCEPYITHRCSGNYEVRNHESRTGTIRKNTKTCL